LEFVHDVAMANSSKRKRRLWDAYAFTVCHPLPTLRGVFGDSKALVVTVSRRSKIHPLEYAKIVNEKLFWSNER
jgi:hypothetical protein